MAADDSRLRRLLAAARTIAVVGLSASPRRPSHSVGAYLLAQGYTLLPVTPTYDSVLGLPAHDSLADIPADVRVDIVTVFRREEEMPALARQAAQRGAAVFWQQLGLASADADGYARAHGMESVMDRCIMVEHRRLLGAAAARA